MRYLLLALAAWSLGTALAQQAATPAPSAKPASKPAKVAVGPTWNELSSAQQQSLRPLAAQWGTLSEAQKRKWIALSQNYPKLAPDEQAKLHSRMTEWVALSPQQRTQARLNFAGARQIPADDKKAKWEAYQSLSPEEKNRLAARAAKASPKPAGAAAAVKPVPAQKLANVPARAKPGAQGKPHIAAGPGQLDHNTLLPHPGGGAAAPAAHTSN